ncbi:MAG: AI-2E family transporter [Phycisphaerales bacterium]|nr:AI-2E family transporter [Phycisphaerales bacterium]
MFDSPQPYTFDRVVRMVLTTAVLLAIFFLLRYLSDVLVPFAAAAVLAYFLHPLVRLIERSPLVRNRVMDRFVNTPNKQRGLAVAFTLLGVFGIGAILALAVAVISIHQVHRFEGELKNLRAGTQQWFEGITTAQEAATQDPGTKRPGTGSVTTSAPADEKDETKSSYGIVELKEAWSEFLSSSAPDRFDRLREKVAGTATGTALDRAVEFVHTNTFNDLVLELVRRIAVGGITVINFAVELFIGATVVLVILLYLMFLLLDFPNYSKTWRSFLPPSYRDNILGFLEEFEVVLRRYFRGQFIIASLTGLFFAVGFSIIGLPMAIPFGLFIGVLNMVPYLQLVALVPAVILAIMRSIGGDSSLLNSFLWVGVVFAVVQVVQDGLITPRIMGKVTGLSPVAILLGMFIWGKLLGFLGLLLAIPLTCLGIAYYRRFVLRHSEEETSLKSEPQ